MLPHQQRVVEEKRDLDEKIKRLDDFSVSEKYQSLDLAEKLRLRSQFKIMSDYSEMLSQRIAAFSSGIEQAGGDAAASLRAHEQRVIEEKRLLDAKIKEYEDIKSTEVFSLLPEMERDAIRGLIPLMRSYSEGLSYRISRFENQGN